MRRRHTRGGGTKVPPASCESPPLPSGRAARVKVSGALVLAAQPPQRVSKSGLLPQRGAHRAPAHRHPAGASPLCKRRAQAKHRQHPRLPGQAQDRTAATLSQIKFFHRMWTNLFAVAGSRGHPPAGVTHKRGLRPPLARPRRVGAPFLACRSTRNPLPARCGHIRCPLGTLPRVAGAQCAPLRSGVSRPSR